MLCITQSDINSRKIDKGTDKYGHWSYIKFAAHNSTVFTVITAYKPCVVTKITDITTYHQQLALHQSETTTTINPHKAFTCDLLKWMLLGHRKGEKIILGGGFNESLTSTSDIIKFCSHDDLKLIDIFVELTQESFSTTKTGKQRIDYMLISPELKQSV